VATGGMRRGGEGRSKVEFRGYPAVHVRVASSCHAYLENTSDEVALVQALLQVKQQRFGKPLESS